MGSRVLSTAGGPGVVPYDQGTFAREIRRSDVSRADSSGGRRGVVSTRWRDVLYIPRCSRRWSVTSWERSVRPGVVAWLCHPGKIQLSESGSGKQGAINGSRCRQSLGDRRPRGRHSQRAAAAGLVGGILIAGASGPYAADDRRHCGTHLPRVERLPRREGEGCGRRQAARLAVFPAVFPFDMVVAGAVR